MLSRRPASGDSKVTTTMIPPIGAGLRLLFPALPAENFLEACRDWRPPPLSHEPHRVQLFLLLLSRCREFFHCRRGVEKSIIELKPTGAVTAFCKYVNTEVCVSKSKWIAGWPKSSAFTVWLLWRLRVAITH